jgi:hypothetical protein
MEAIEENKSLLKTMYADAKAFGEKVNRARDVSFFSCHNGLQAHEFLKLEIH